MKHLPLLLASGFALTAQSLTGVWDSTVVSGGVTVPFRMEFSSDGPSVQAWFFNADDRTPSTAGSLENGALRIQFAQLGTRLEASLKDGRLDGAYIGSRRTGTLKFHAERATDVREPDQAAPSINGEWELNKVRSGKGESAWRFLVQQSGAEVTATILRVDGDTGALTGRYRNGKFVLSHFSGARAALLEIEPRADGALHLLMDGRTEYTALRPQKARADGLTGPTDPDRHTSVNDPTEPFHFSFKDMNGKVVSESDARFKNKVVIVSILGSWCPNCHDEAPYLAELYRSYRDKGLEIVGLSFEEEDQLADPVRLRAFVKSYGIDYPMLVCGVPDEASKKMPQLKGFDAWPTILLLGRDGRVRQVHSGFPSRASGDVYRQTKNDLTANIERLLAQ
ncbi:MAG TPA: TlpA disulfide reductase family protein [Bryobacteraceae bacterium]|jgi:thiol-disulfide isomerase/thioredoxin|nr:TlpA disulfide reductase family protein [Bryobacteraceae bacterium]